MQFSNCLQDERDYSIVGVSENPTVELNAARGLGVDHAPSEEHLSGLVVEDDDHEERDGWNGEMRERDESCSEHQVDERHVAKDSAEDGLEAKSEVSVTVDHTLLGDRQVTGLADQKIGPLHANDGNEVTALSVVQSFDSPADLVGRDVRVLVEVGHISIGHPAALTPLFSGSIDEEKTHIDTRLLEANHVHDLTITIFEVRVTTGRLIWCILISVSRHDTFLGSEAKEDTRGKAIIVHNIEVGEESSSSLNYTDLEVGEGDELRVDKMVSLGDTRVALHDIELGVLVGERDGGDHISTQVNAQDKHSGEGLGDLEHHEEQEGRDLGNVGGESVSDRLLQVIEDKATFFNTVYDRGEVIIEEKHVSGVLGDLRARAHSDTDISLFDSRGVIDTITSDSDDMTKSLASINNEEFLGGSSSGEDNFFFADPVHDGTALFDLIIIKSIFF